jgi:hypothetical protein
METGDGPWSRFSTQLIRRGRDRPGTALGAGTLIPVRGSIRSPLDSNLTIKAPKGTAWHRFNTGVRQMKKTYDKPTLIKKDRLSAVTAQTNNSPPPNNPM